MNSTHRTNVVRIASILPHPNADRLEIIPIEGFQVVVGKGQFKVGELAVYVQPDSVVPPRSEYSFVWEKDGGGNLRVIVPEMEIPEKWRRVTVRRLRKEWSEGLLMPTIAPYEDTLNGIDFYRPSSFALLRDNGDTGKQIQVVEGDDVSEFLGITHWNPPEPDEVQSSGPSIKQSKIWPRSLKGWLYFLSYWLSFGLYDPWGDLGGANEKAPEHTPPIYDVEAFKNYTQVFVPGEDVVITEKIHGSNFRCVFMPGFGKGKFYVGSRKLWKRAKSSNVWRKAAKENPDLERWCRDNPKYTLYGEVVPTQKGFDYGATPEHPRVLVFDIRDSEGNWVPKTQARLMTEGYSIEWVSLFAVGGWNPEVATTLVEGKTQAGGNHIREGVVICTVPDRYVRECGRAQLKVISSAYYEKTKE
jgi:hypothetical protein